jgi:uncharacterized protein (TIGR02271 family)
MQRTVFATFRTEAEAERTLSLLAREVPLLDSAVVSDGVAGALTLDSLKLTREERSACETQLKRGVFLLIAQAADSDADAVLRMLHGAAGDSAPLIIAEASPASPAPPSRTVQPSRPDKGIEAEERIPLIQEELRIGKREVLRGGARIHSFITEVPVQEQVELFSEETSVTRRPVNRRLTPEEVIEGGLLRERVIEVTSMREEAVVSKEAFVREELVVTKSVQRRIEQINETVRRTEVETEELAPGGGSAFGAFESGDRETPNAGGKDRQR